ncbi:MAG: DUF1028 domain-containing protein [Flavobacteriaceae bacterium]
MNKKSLLIILVLQIGFCTQAQMYIKSNPFAHTFSIVARDSVTGDMGVAVQSHWFGVGSLVAWGKAGVGVVATQSFINPSFGPRGLTLMENGLTPKMAVTNLLALDAGRDVRQVAMLNAQGDVYAFTGKNCIEFAGHQTGKNFSTQANLMAKPTVWPAMAKAFETTKGTLAERLLAALDAAQAEGGDIRGKQAAALIVVKAKSTGNVWEDTLVNLRIDDNDNPIEELHRLLNIHTAYEFMNQGDLAVEKGDFKLAKDNYMKAQGLNPDNVEMKFWYAVTLSNNGDYKVAKPIFSKIFKEHKNWQILIPRLVKAKLLFLTPQQLTELTRL